MNGGVNGPATVPEVRYLILKVRASWDKVVSAFFLLPYPLCTRACSRVYRILQSPKILQLSKVVKYPG